MKQPPSDPLVADVDPTDTDLTVYDEEHIIQYLRMLDADAEGADWREVAQLVLKIDPELEHDRAAAVDFFVAMDRRDVRVIQGSQQVCFTREPRAAFPIGGHGLRQHLDGDLALEMFIARSVDDAHRPAAQRSHDPIPTTQELPVGSGHRCRCHRSHLS